MLKILPPRTLPHVSHYLNQRFGPQIKTFDHKDQNFNIVLKCNLIFKGVSAARFYDAYKMWCQKINRVAGFKNEKIAMIFEWGFR